MGKSVALKPAGLLDLRILVDRTSIEIFAEGGHYVMSFCFRPDPGNRKLILSAEGGAAVAKSVQVRILKHALPVAAR
jgi:sucrose-6-phosphate hydrolase SacC (GH32 family)